MKNFLRKFNEGEHLVKVVEPDLSQFVPKFVWYAIPLLYIAGVLYVFYAFRPGQMGSYVIVGASAILLLLYARRVRLALSTYLLVTSDRLIYVKCRGLFRKDVFELHYNQFKTVSCHFKGFFSSVFRVGEIVIDRGGVEDSIVLEHVRHPQTVQDLIMKLQREYTYIRQLKEMENGGHGAFSPMAYSGYLSARDLILFLGKMLSIEEQKYMTTNIGHNNPSPVSYRSIPPQAGENNTYETAGEA